jgi:hypothetical protein
MVVPSCDNSIWEAEIGGSQVQGQPGLHREALSENTNKRIKLSNNIPIFQLTLQH